MKKNIELKEIGKRLFRAGSVVLFPHVNPDGDAVGACVALCLALRSRGVQCWVYSEGVPDFLKFLNTEMFTDDYGIIAPPDICVAIDCSDGCRMDSRLMAFEQGDVHMCIDHHQGGTGYGDYYYIDENAAATCEIIYSLLKVSGAEFSRDMANALYTGLSTDTSNYRHSNTTPESHRIAAELLEIGVDHTNIMVNLYQSKGVRKVICGGRAIQHMHIFAEGRGAMTYLTAADLVELDSQSQDADEVINILQNMEGVEIAGYLEERENGIKVSLRAKTYGNVAAICRKYDGGGHIKAAGCTMNMSMEDAFAQIKYDIEEAL